MTRAPGHTDLMVTPESLDEWLELNPLPPQRGYDARQDYEASCTFASAYLRERSIRAGEEPPRPDNATEQRWAREGLIPRSEFDTARGTT